MKDLNAHDLEEATKIICGSARSMGIEVKNDEKNPKDIKNLKETYKKKNFINLNKIALIKKMSNPKFC